MRRRDLHLFKPSPEWLKTAEDAKAAVAKKEKKIGDCSAVWADLKPMLAELSHRKCWYCESRQSRSDNAVDHFRPKSRYPWRAFSPKNFRFVCTYCNSRRKNPETGETEGKGDAFPLFEGNQRASREEDIGLEEPILLDPCVAADCGLLDFQTDGTPCPASPNEPRVVDRVKQSIKYYHLDHPELNEQRRVLALQIKEWIDAADLLYPFTAKGGTPQASSAFYTLADTLARRMDDHAELSSFARRVVKNYRARPWVEWLLDA